MGGTEHLITAALAALQTVQAVGGARRDASYSNQQAALVRAQAAADAIEKRRASARELGSVRARLGAAGVTVEGSPIEVLADVAAEGELEARKTVHRGEVAANAHEYQALEATSRAGSALLSGAGSVFDHVVEAGSGKALKWWNQPAADGGQQPRPRTRPPR